MVIFSPGVDCSLNITGKEAAQLIAGNCLLKENQNA